MIFLFLIKMSDLNKKFRILAEKSELKVEQDKIVKFQAFDSKFFLVTLLFKRCFFYQPTFNTLELKKTKALIMLFFENKRFISI